MYRQIVTPANTTLILQLPSWLVGKEIEVTAEERKHTKSKKRVSKRRLELEKFYGKYAFDVSLLKLSRDEANQR